MPRTAWEDAILKDPPVPGTQFARHLLPIAFMDDLPPWRTAMVRVLGVLEEDEGVWLPTVDVPWVQAAIAVTYRMHEGRLRCIPRELPGDPSRASYVLKQGVLVLTLMRDDLELRKSVSAAALLGGWDSAAMLIEARLP